MEYVELRKELLGALIGLAKTCSNNPKTEQTDSIIIEGLVAVKEENFGEEMLRKKLEKVRLEKQTIAPNCSTCASPCGNTSEFNLDLLAEDEAQSRSLKERMLQGILDVAVKLYRARLMGADVSERTEILYQVLEVVTYRMEVSMLEPILSEVEVQRQELNNLRKVQ